MQNWWFTWQLGKMKHNEAIKKAELLRLAHKNSSNHRDAPNGLRVVLGNLGNLLLFRRLSIQARHEAKSRRQPDCGESNPNQRGGNEYDQC